MHDFARPKWAACGCDAELGNARKSVRLKPNAPSPPSCKKSRRVRPSHRRRVEPWSLSIGVLCNGLGLDDDAILHDWPASVTRKWEMIQCADENRPVLRKICHEIPTPDSCTDCSADAQCRGPVSGRREGGRSHRQAEIHRYPLFAADARRLRE